LPDRPSDIDVEILRLRETDPSREILLLIDHLDRLDEDEYGLFWLDQLARLRSWPWLHVILASRPEEFDRSLGAALLNRYTRCKLQGPKAPFVGGETDAEERGRASAIERGLKGSPPAQVRRLAVLAFGMGLRRRTELPIGIALSGDSAKYRGTTAVVRCPDGTTRFMHDAIQDYLSAFHIASELSVGNVDDKEGLQAWVRSLARLPRDVPRLLFDLLASDGWLMTRPQRRRAAEALSLGLFQDRTTECWLHDTGRIEQARLAVEEFELRHANNPQVRMTTGMLLGFAAQRRHWGSYLADRTKRVRELETMRVCVSRFIQSAREAELLLAEGQPREDDERFLRLHLAIVSHQVVMLLAGMTEHDAVRDEAWIMAREAVGKLVFAKDPPVLGPGWLARLLTTIERGASHRELLDLLERVFNETEALLPKEGVGPTWLDGHLSSTAANLSTGFTEQGCPERRTAENLKTAMRFQLRCLSLTERIARWTGREEWRYPYWGFLDRAHAYSHVAWQKSKLFQVCLLSVGWFDRTPESVAQALEAHSAQQDAWDLAKRMLAPGSRLCNWFRHALPMLVAGGALQDLIEDAGALVSADVAMKLLERRGKALFQEYQRIGEPTPRFAGKDDSVEGVIGFYRDALGDVPTLLANLARTTRG